MATLEETRLIEKIVRAKVALERSRVRHKDGCMTEDPESTAPCNCGASATNSALSSAIKELSFE